MRHCVSALLSGVLGVIGGWAASNGPATAQVSEPERFAVKTHELLRAKRLEVVTNAGKPLGVFVAGGPPSDFGVKCAMGRVAGQTDHWRIAHDCVGASYWWRDPDMIKNDINGVFPAVGVSERTFEREAYIEPSRIRIDDYASIDGPVSLRRRLEIDRYGYVIDVEHLKTYLSRAGYSVASGRSYQSKAGEELFPGRRLDVSAFDPYDSGVAIKLVGPDCTPHTAMRLK